MSSNTSQPGFQLYYWPIPFRGCFVSYLFAYRDVPLLQEASYEENISLMSRHPGEQDVPFMGPPVIRDLESGRTLSQMPAIVFYVSRELDFMPEDPFDVAMCMKILMDCNDVLVEICRNNGSTMWDRKDWVQFRSQRLPRWMQIFEESLKRGHIGKEPVSFADIGVFALFGNMTRCLPELEADLLRLGKALQVLHVLLDVRDDLVKQRVDKGGILGEAVKDEFLQRTSREVHRPH